MLNVSVGKGMPFKKVSQKTKKGEVWRVGFMAVEDEKEGAKQIMLNVKKEDVDEFHEKLEKLPYEVGYYRRILKERPLKESEIQNLLIGSQNVAFRSLLDKI